MKSNSTISITHEGDALTFAVRDAGTLTLNLSRVSAAVRAMATIHGFKQRIADAAAIPRDTATGKPASPADKFAAMRALVEHYESGSEEWSIRKSGGGGQSTGLLRRAMAAFLIDRHAMSEADARKRADAWMEANDREAKAAMLASPPDYFRPFLDAERARATSGVDTEALFANL